MLLMLGARAVTGEFYYGSIVLALLLTAGAAGLLALAILRAPDCVTLGLALLFVSRAFLDFATSGLENALAHFLLALFVVTLLDENRPAPAAILRLSTLGALLALTRLDLLALVAPAFAWRFFTTTPRRAILPALLGALPLVAWEIFSVLYYGFPVANTVYAKLATALPPAGVIRHGLEYLVNSLRSDPVTLPAIAAGVAAAFSGRSVARRALGAGIVLHLLYIVGVGGDFMSGRFLTAPLFVAVALLALRLPEGVTVRAAACAIALLFGAWPATSPFNFRPPARGSAFDQYGIADERRMHFESAWIGNVPADGPWPNPDSYEQARQIRINWTYQHWVTNLAYFGIVDRDEYTPYLATSGVAESPLRRVILRGAVGVLGYYLGPDYHILDYMALGDPLLARLPALRKDPMLGTLDPALAALDYRAGHYIRRVPAGYYETLVVGENRIRDPRLAAYYDHLALVTRGPLLDRGRLLEIWRLNTGRYDELLRPATGAP